MNHLDGPIDPQVVNVPVPVQHLPVVYKALASVMGGGTGAPISPPPQPTAKTSDEKGGVLVENNGWWSEAMVRDLCNRLPYPGVKALVTLMAERAPKEITLAEAAPKTTTIKQLRAELGALSKLTNKMFGEKVWPFTVRYSAGGVSNYWMRPEVAAWWLEDPSGEKGGVG